MFADFNYGYIADEMTNCYDEISDPTVIHVASRIPLTKASDVELWCFLWSVPE